MPRSLFLALTLSLLTVSYAVPARAAVPSDGSLHLPAPRFHLVDTTAQEAGDDRFELLTKLSMAQFHHLRAMHGIGWGMLGLLTTPGLAVFGAVVMVGGAIGGAVTGDTGALIAGLVIVIVAAGLFVVSVPVLIGNIIQATATAARVEELRMKLLRAGDVAAFVEPESSDRTMLSLAFAF